MLNLTLSKKTGAIITAPDGTEIKIEYIRKIGGGQARIGFDAPREYKINRFKTGGESGQETQSLCSHRDDDKRTSFRDLCEDV